MWTPTVAYRARWLVTDPDRLAFRRAPLMAQRTFDQGQMPILSTSTYRQTMNAEQYPAARIRLPVQLNAAYLPQERGFWGCLTD